MKHLIYFVIMLLLSGCSSELLKDHPIICNDSFMGDVNEAQILYSSQYQMVTIDNQSYIKTSSGKVYTRGQCKQ